MNGGGLSLRVVECFLDARRDDGRSEPIGNLTRLGGHAARPLVAIDEPKVLTRGRPMRQMSQRLALTCRPACAAPPGRSR
jgi:hypothetical protein